MPKLRVLLEPNEVTRRRLAYMLLRVAIGLSIAGHGLVRVPKLATFADSLTEQFTQSIIPTALVGIGGYALPVAELVIGLTVTIGFFTYLSLIGGTLSLVFLIFGSTTIENWSSIGDQLLHVIPLITLIAFSNYNTYSVDRALLRRFYGETVR